MIACGKPRNKRNAEMQACYFNVRDAICIKNSKDAYIYIYLYIYILYIYIYIYMCGTHVYTFLVGIVWVIIQLSSTLSIKSLFNFRFQKYT